MSFRLEHRTDKSVALLIDGQLQFDSLDEQIYHECLALPAAALACQRFPSKKLRVLVCGGGDGLLMRELFKCEQIASIDLVERDEAILQLARHELNELNCNSLQDPRLRIHRADAWEHLQNSDREYEL